MARKNTIKTLMEQLISTLDSDISWKDDSFEPIKYNKGVWVVREFAAHTRKAVLFDNDGTLSDLRKAWQDMMGPMFIGILQAYSNPHLEYNRAAELVLDMIEASIGKPTMCQAAGLVRLCEDNGYVGKPLDPRKFKNDYNDALEAEVERRYSQNTPSKLRVPGAYELVRSLHELELYQGLYVASGTDDGPTKRSIKKLVFSDFFPDDRIMGAGGKLEPWQCAKEYVINRLIGEFGIKGESLVTFGDGPVEIKKTKDVGGLAFGVASDEQCMYPTRFTKDSKRDYLIRSGADVILELPYNIPAILKLMETGFSKQT